MKLECFLYPGWRPRIRAASRRRPWMDETPESFAYRCLPLAIANAHGWEIGNAVGFSARWNGGRDVTDVEIRLDDPAHSAVEAPVSLFGQGTLTFHIAGLFRTEPGWNLWIGGPPNAAKDGIAPLSGVIETDWSPYSFTMNWRFTRPNHWVRFELDETIAFFFPLERRAIEETIPSFLPIEEAPDLQQMFEQWAVRAIASSAECGTHRPPNLPINGRSSIIAGSIRTGSRVPRIIRRNFVLASFPI
jgi:hypothetical protein